MAFTQDDLDAINEAIASGALEVQFADGKRTRYRSMVELMKAKAHIESVIARTAGNRPIHGVRVNVNKGL